MEEEDVGAAVFGNRVNVLQYADLDIIHARINDMASVYVHHRTFLVILAERRSSEATTPTNAIGLSFRILVLILWTMSGSPDTQTLVTRPFRGLRCSAGIGLGSDEVTVASNLPPLLSLSTLQSFLN